MLYSFNGTFQHSVDPKGRVTIPSKFRDAFGEGFTIGLNGDLAAVAIYPAAEWRQVEEKLNRIPISDARAAAYVRMVRAFSFTDQQMDGQGRILLPNVLRERVQLEKDISFVGMGGFLEVWNTERLEACFREIGMAGYQESQQYANDKYIIQP